MGKYDSIFKLDQMILNIGCVALSILRCPKILMESNVLKKNKELTSYKKSDRCYILGLGPSLRNVDLSKLDGDIIVTNRFINYDEADKIKPTYYCLIDEAFYKESSSDTLKTAMNMYPNTVFMLNGKHRKFAEQIINDSNIKRYYAYLWSGIFNTKKEINYCKVLPIMGNVVCFAIMTALGLGYKEIILLGCDFNSFASRKSNHCYYENKTDRQNSMSFELFCYSFVADAHCQLNKYAQLHNQKIINATYNSLIDAYCYDEKKVQYYMKE